MKHVQHCIKKYWKTAAIAYIVIGVVLAAGIYVYSLFKGYPLSFDPLLTVVSWPVKLIRLFM